MNIAALVGEESLSTTQERMRGISHAASIYGAEVTFHFGHYSVESGEEMAQVVFNNGLPDALIVASPRLMAGVMRAFTRLNVRVPHDVVIGGYDDPEWYSFVGAGITTFVPPHEEMGKEAVRLLVDLIENPELPTGDVVLQGQVILRGRAHIPGRIAQMSSISRTIALELGVKDEQVEAAIKLLDEGNTVPFIARYRKEITGGLDDTQLRDLEERLSYLRELEDRKQSILAAIEEQGKLTDDLRSLILGCDTKARLEDLYLPFKNGARRRPISLGRRAWRGSSISLSTPRPRRRSAGSCIYD